MSRNIKQEPISDRTAGGRAERADRRLALASRIAGIMLQDGLGDLGLRGLAARLDTSDRMLLYYFQTKEELVTDALDQVDTRLATLLARHDGGPHLSPGQFLTRVLALASDAETAPFMRLWAEVIARGARGERPYDRIGAKCVRSWIDWIDSRLTPLPTGADPARAAALLSIVEGMTLLELASPGSTTGVQAYLSHALDTENPSGRTVHERCFPNRSDPRGRSVTMPAAEAILLFSYGTLQDEAVQRSWFGRRLAGTSDVLAGFQQGEIELTDQGETRRYPIIAASGDPADRIAGQVFVLSCEELAAADLYEGDDYARIQVRLESGRQAWVYARP